jgi:polysaccharide deacetylase family protein (PEP-CTERM system associated)
MLRTSTASAGGDPVNPINCQVRDTMSYLLLTVDVEDWFQVENLRAGIPISTWPSCESRVERNTNLLLDLLDSVEAGPVKATFFVLGWLARRVPGLIREIGARGHEVASHGYSHRLCVEHAPWQLRNDLKTSKDILEDLIGKAIDGYRAPSFSINHHALKIVEECGFRYDSSFNSLNLNQRYGQLDLTGSKAMGISRQLSTNFSELPISNLRVGSRTIPCGGGGYFRLAPFPLFRRGAQRILELEDAYLFYIHPWELDPHQPRVEGISRFLRFRHYLHLDRTYGKLRRLITDFSHCRFETCSGYLKAMEGLRSTPMD